MQGGDYSVRLPLMQLLRVQKLEGKKNPSKTTAKFGTHKKTGKTTIKQADKEIYIEIAKT